MADFTAETVTRRIHRWIVPAAEPWGAAAAEIGKAWAVAERAYREQHGLDREQPLHDDALRFHVRDEAVVIEFQTEAPTPPALPRVDVRLAPPPDCSTTPPRPTPGTNTEETPMSDIHNPTAWSDFDFLEFEAFVSKVENEGFTYAAENYGPNFESPELQAIAADLGQLRTLYVENEAKVDDWYALVGGERACDLHNDHVDEERQRREDARLFGIRCTDGFVLTEDTEESRDNRAAYLLENEGKGWRVPAVLLRRDVAGGEWTDEREVTRPTP